MKVYSEATRGQPTQDMIDREVQSAIEGRDGEIDSDPSTWHEDPDPTHRGFDWHLLFIGLALAGVLAWSAHKSHDLRLNAKEITCEVRPTVSPGLVVGGPALVPAQ